MSPTLSPNPRNAHVLLRELLEVAVSAGIDRAYKHHTNPPPELVAEIASSRIYESILAEFALGDEEHAAVTSALADAVATMRQALEYLEAFDQGQVPTRQMVDAARVLKFFVARVSP